jgi:hypothetical protein
MYKLLALLQLVVTASISVGRLALAESRFKVLLPRPLAIDVGPDEPGSNQVDCGMEPAEAPGGR